LFSYSYMDATDIMSENVHLRELLLSHLDIIQQQVFVPVSGTVLCTTILLFDRVRNFPGLDPYSLLMETEFIKNCKYYTLPL
jgi:hypothetical protein